METIKDIFEEMDITCVICNKKPDKIEQYYDMFKQQYICRVYCHGDCLEFKINSDDILQATEIKLQREVRLWKSKKYKLPSPSLGLGYEKGKSN